MKRVRVEYEVDDDFRKGCCYDCPMYDFINENCVCGWKYDECRIEEVIHNADDDIL